MYKIDMAVEVVRVLFSNDNVDKNNWKVKDLMKANKAVLSDLYDMANKAKKFVPAVYVAKVKPVAVTKIMIKSYGDDAPRAVKVGDILHTSWGYNMTHNDYAKIKEISPTGKTVKCVMVSNTKIDGGGFAGREKPNENAEISPEFRLRVNDSGFKGSYYFCAPNSGKRMGYFSPWDGKDDYYNTMD